jgi:hypothetical protein
MQLVVKSRGYQDTTHRNIGPGGFSISQENAKPNNVLHLMHTVLMTTYVGKVNSLLRCMKGYVQRPRRVDKYKDKFCLYEQKQQLKAFLLEFFLTSGIGHFYCLRVSMGIIKLLVTISFFVFYSVMKCKYSEIKCKNELLPESERNELFQHSIVSLFCISTVGFLICHIFDLYMFGTNQYQDGNSVPLESW